jgi:flagellar motor switch protein FliG
VSNESSEALIPPLRKAAIILISLEQSLASQLLAHLDRAAVEAVTWEIARLDRVDPAEQDAVLEEFFGLGLRRLCFTFEDLDKLRDRDIRELYDPSEATLWALALASASAPTRDKVLGSLTASTERDLRQALERLGPFRLAESEAAQMEIAERFRSLSDRGAIHLPAPTGRDDLLV